MLRKRRTTGRRQFFRFALVGAANTAVDFAVFTMLFRFAHVHYSVCQAVGYTVGIINSFLWNKYWTFARVDEKPAGSQQNADHRITAQSRQRRNTVQFLKFVAVNLISLGVTVAGLAILVELAEIAVLPAKIIIIAAAQLINFSGYKLWVFTPSEID